MDATAITQLVKQLKELPLIDGADPRPAARGLQRFRAVEQRDPGGGAAPGAGAPCRGQNGRLFQRFVVECFPADRGRGDRVYAERLWAFRCAFVKDRRTGPFKLIHGAPELHLTLADDGRPILNLESLIEDYRVAVDDLGKLWASTPELQAIAVEELAARRGRHHAGQGHRHDVGLLHHLGDVRDGRRGARGKRHELSAVADSDSTC
jgi:hypothetical protein